MIKDPSNIQKHYNIDPEETLNNVLLKKFGKRFSDYRKRYDENIHSGVDQKYYDYPNTVVLELVNRCNLECVMCYQGFRNNATKFTLTEEMLDKIFNDFKKNKLNSLMLSISEPLLYKNIGDILKRAEEANIMDVFLFTNGALLNEKNANLILNSCVTRLFVSIDAATEQTYDKVRIPVGKTTKKNRLKNLEANIKNFMTIKKNLKKLLPLVRVSYVSLSDNQHEKDLFLKKWSNIVDSVEFQREISIKAYEDFNIDKSEKIDGKKYFCSEPWGQVSIYSDGTVVPCCATFGRNINVGNIKNETLKEIWNGELMQEIRTSFINNTPSKACLSCINNTADKI